MTITITATADETVPTMQALRAAMGAPPATGGALAFLASLTGEFKGSLPIIGKDDAVLDFKIGPAVEGKG